MKIETVLTDEQIKELFEWHIDDPEVKALSFDFARDIEKAILRSEQVQRWNRDAERIDWIESQAKKSPTGISFDYHKYVEDGYVLERGFRFMRQHFASGFKDNIRKAIDAATEQIK